MSLTRSTGTQVAIASTYGTASTMTAITNATEAVATLSAGHTVAVGDYIEITSGWSLLNGRIARAKAVSTNDVTLEGIDTSNTSDFPAGEGIGSAREITAWTTITQIKKDGGITKEGGETKYEGSSTLDDEDDKEIPNGRTAQKLRIAVYDDPTLSWYSVVRAAADGGTPVAIRLIYRNGSKTFANGYWSMQDLPEHNAVLENSVGFSASARLTRYAN